LNEAADQIKLSANKLCPQTIFCQNCERFETLLILKAQVSHAKLIDEKNSLVA